MCRVALHDGIGWYVLHENSPGTDDGTISDGNAAPEHDVRFDAHVIADDDLPASSIPRRRG